MSSRSRKAPKSTALIAQRNSTGDLEVKIGADGLPEPQRSLVANWAAVRRCGAHLYLWFGSTLPFGPRKITAALQVMVNLDSARQMVDDNPRFFEQLSSFVAAHALHQSLGDAEVDFAPDVRLVTERASFVAHTFVGPDAEMRFYRLGLQATNRLIVTRSITPDVANVLEAVVRVELPSGLLIAVRDQIRTEVRA